MAAAHPRQPVFLSRHPQVQELESHRLHHHDRGVLRRLHSVGARHSRSAQPRARCFPPAGIRTADHHDSRHADCRGRSRRTADGRDALPRLLHAPDAEDQQPCPQDARLRNNGSHDRHLHGQDGNADAKPDAGERDTILRTGKQYARRGRNEPNHHRRHRRQLHGPARQQQLWENGSAGQPDRRSPAHLAQGARHRLSRCQAARGAVSRNSVLDGTQVHGDTR